MKYLFWAAFVLLLDVSLSQEAPQEFNVSIEPSGQAVVPVGQDLTVLCRVGHPITVCRVKIPGHNGVYLHPNQPISGNIQYFGSTLEEGQCGVRITRVNESYAGQFKCTMLPEGQQSEIEASTTILVADIPSNLELTVSPGSREEEIYGKGENLIASCRVMSGIPPANISLYLDETPIGIEEEPTIYHANGEKNSLIVKNVSHVLDWTDNGKTLRCVVDQIALPEPLTTSKQIQVQFSPGSVPVIEQSGQVIGQPGIVKVMVRANPKPHFRWYVDKEEIDQGHHDRSNRIEASVAEKVDASSWVATLRINSLQESDANKKYIVEARNALGHSTYEIVIPRPTKSAGGLIGRTCLHEQDCVRGDKNAYCDTTRKQCACINGFVPSVNNQRCLPGIGTKCQTDQECLDGMEEEQTSMRCLMNQCACTKGFEGFEGKCQPEGQISGGIRSVGASVFATACFLLLSAVL